MEVDPMNIRFSQDSVARSVIDIANSIQREGFIYRPEDGFSALDVVYMPDGVLTSLDNRRLLAARMTNTSRVPVNIHNYNESLPSEFMTQRAQPGHRIFNNARTWGEAIEGRILDQSSWTFRNFEQNGSHSEPLIVFNRNRNQVRELAFDFPETIANRNFTEIETLPIQSQRTLINTTSTNETFAISGVASNEIEAAASASQTPLTSIRNVETVENLAIVSSRERREVLANPAACTNIVSSTENVAANVRLTTRNNSRLWGWLKQNKLKASFIAITIIVEGVNIYFAVMEDGGSFGKKTTLAISEFAFTTVGSIIGSSFGPIGGLIGGIIGNLIGKGIGTLFGLFWSETPKLYTPDIDVLEREWDYCVENGIEFTPRLNFWKHLVQYQKDEKFAIFDFKVSTSQIVNEYKTNKQQKNREYLEQSSIIAEEDEEYKQKKEDIICSYSLDLQIASDLLQINKEQSFSLYQQNYQSGIQSHLIISTSTHQESYLNLNHNSNSNSALNTYVANMKKCFPK